MSKPFSNRDLDALPAAQAVYIDNSNGDPLAAAVVDAADIEANNLLQDSTTEAEPLLMHQSDRSDKKEEANESTEKMKDGSTNDPQITSGFTVMNQQTNHHWGRFNDPVVEAHLATDDNDTINVPVATARPDDRAIRLVFIRKVYSILSVQLLTTFGVCALFAMNETAHNFITGNMVLYWCNLVLCFGTLVPLHAYKRTYPTNFILLSVFTMSMATMVGTVTSIYADAGASDLVLEAVFITASVFIVLTIFTLQSKWDFSFLGAGLGMCLWVMILWGFFAIIFGLQTGFIYGLAGSILFSGFIIYDTYMICERLDPEDYIVAAIELYLDLINLFLYILQMLGEANRR